MHRAGDMSGEDVTQAALEMLLAGTDTSSVTLSWLPLALRVGGWVGVVEVVAMLPSVCVCGGGGCTHVLG